jgi:cyclic lactone autoinducer peptide
MGRPDSGARLSLTAALAGVITACTMGASQPEAPTSLRLALLCAASVGACLGVIAAALPAKKGCKAQLWP